MFRLSHMLAATIAAVLTSVCLYAANAADASILGAGSSAAAPVYRTWATEYAKAHGDALTYEPVGSGAGMSRIRKREVDFGASDVVASKEELERDGLIMIPTVITGVVPVVNLPGMRSNALLLSGDVLARIFSGSVVQWDAPEIKALNPGLVLPAQRILLVVREDSSGTTYHYTDYLSRVSPAWRQERGSGNKVNWPRDAIAVKGSGEVSKTVRATPGAIGYIDYNYVVDDGLTAVSMQNASGRFVIPGVEGFREAVRNSAWFTKGDFTASINDGPGTDTWPITMGTYIAVPSVTTQSDRTERALRFVTWAFLHGDALARQAKFVPLPDKVQASAYREIARVTSAQGERLGVMVLGKVLK